MTTHPTNILIIGGGLAGAKAAEALRSQGFTGPVTLIGNEPDPPYERPPMSKSYLMGRAPFEDALVHPTEWYDEHDIELRLSTRAASFDPVAHTVSLDDGTTLPYSALLLATGSIPRRLPVPGADANGVLYLRTRADSEAIQERFGPGRRLVIIGAGWIGLEVAAAARGADTDVTVIERSELPLLGVLGPELAQVFADLHTANGVDLRLGTTVAEIIVTDGRATGVRLGDGTAVPADAIVVGIGATPDVALAEAAKLAIDNGVLVDAGLRTSNADVYAVGDIANQAHPVLGVRIRVEHWATALNQPSTAVAAMLGATGAAASYVELPYFYSDQYDLGMEYIGYAPTGAYERVVIRGDLASREFVAFWLNEADQIKAAMNVNVWDVVNQVKPLIAHAAVVDPVALADPDVSYADVATAASGARAGS